MNFLDENGLGRLWAQIVLKLNSKVPDGGTTGQILKRTETGTEWADAPQTVTIPETTALLKGDGIGGVSAAVNGTDYAEPSVAFTVTLSASGWSGKAQTVSDARFLTGGYAYSVAPDSGSFAAYGNAVIYADNVTTAGKMQFHCGEVPTAALTVNILRMEASA